MLQMPVFEMKSILLVGCIYVIPVLLVNIFVSKISNTGKMEEITQEINALKADESVFKTLLKTKTKYDVYKSTSSILWGNMDANHMITVVTNPHYNPCALIHKRLVKLLGDTNNGYSVQYILTSFSKELEESCKLFIAMYQRQNISSFLTFLDSWYEKGKNNRKEFYLRYLSDHQEDILDMELQKHKKWLDGTKIRATPTILFNGYVLPEKYHIEDLKYFTHIVV
jgi:protein-disulfide isomerase